ncbi:HAD hydrolase-like protein [Mucilaginibacter gynuensis]|uniref:phosphoglycolate phosphatase n=2 Tax=Mucilaginibacter gynuensis TaxID=1302236 RepID=A0ABP8G7X5_9SPHI
MISKIKGVIFDLDGTIANTLPLCIAAFRKSVEPLAGKALSDEEIVATFGPSEEGTIKALVPQHYDKGVADYLLHYEEMHGLCAGPFEGVVELIASLKERGVKVAMVTGKGKYSTDISLKQFDMLNDFEIIETGAPEGPRKVQGIEIVLNAWKELNKENIIYVGDAPSDIHASRTAGIPVVAAAWAETGEPEQLIPLQPDEIFYTIKDFSNWVGGKI